MSLILGDCLEKMPEIADESVDMVLCDLPYGTTQNKWDSVIPFDTLWAQYKRICKKNAAVVLTASQPFTTALIASNYTMFRYCWIWEKEPSGNLNAKKRPMAAHEDICVFTAGKIGYRPQGLMPTTRRRSANSVSKSQCYGSQTPKAYTQTSTNYPTTLLSVPKDKSKLHPTQKPVALMEYLIATYTNEGDTVLDNCMGSGTTGVACMKLNRKFIGIEKDPTYYDIAVSRIYGF